MSPSKFNYHTLSLHCKLLKHVVSAVYCSVCNQQAAPGGRGHAHVSASACIWHVCACVCTVWGCTCEHMRAFLHVLLLWWVPSLLQAPVFGWPPALPSQPCVFLPLCFSRVASSALFSVCIPSLGGLSCGLGDRLADVSWRPQPRWPGLPRGSGRPPLQALLDCPSRERPRWSSGPPCPSSPPLPTQQCGQLCVSAVLEGTGTMPGAAVGLPSQVGTELWPEGPFTPGGFLLPPRMEPGSGRLPGLPVPWLQLSPAAPPTHPGWAPFPAATTPTSPGNRTTPPLAPPARCITVPIHVPQGPG